MELDINKSTLAEFAEELQKTVFLREHGKLDKNGLLVHNTGKVNYAKLDRKIHGSQNSTRIAALLPYMFEHYKKHKDSLKPELVEQIEAFEKLDSNEQTAIMKKWQLVAMMRSIGRGNGTGKGILSKDKHPDKGHGWQYCEQGAKECSARLQAWGVDKAEAGQLASAIISSEKFNKAIDAEVAQDNKGESSNSSNNSDTVESVTNSTPIDLLGCLLADVQITDTQRDRVPTERKSMSLSWFAFYQNLTDPDSDSAILALKDLADIAAKHAHIIKLHQGFVNHKITVHTWENNDGEEIDKVSSNFQLDIKETKKGNINPTEQEKLQLHTENLTYQQIECGVNYAQDNLQSADDTLPAELAEEPLALKELRGWMDGHFKSTIMNKDTQPKYQVLKTLHRSIREEITSEWDGQNKDDSRTIGDLLGEWIAKSDETIKHKKYGFFAKYGAQKEGYETKTEEFVDKFYKKYKDTPLTIKALTEKPQVEAAEKKPGLNAN